MNPVLKPLETIECRDALLARVGTGEWEKAEWPEANVVIGNPPFLGDRKMIGELGDPYVAALRKLNDGKVPGGADLVLYWVAKGLDELRAGRVARVGFVATNSVRGGANRKVLDKIAVSPGFIAAWDDEPWTVNGAAVRVSIIIYGSLRNGEIAHLDGEPVAQINSDLTASDFDITKAERLKNNSGCAFQGVILRSCINKKDAIRLRLDDADFAIGGDEARIMLQLPRNPNGRKNSDVIVPFLIGRDIVQRASGRFVIDFGTQTEVQASEYEKPFEYIGPVRQHRAHMTQAEALETWWQHWRIRNEMRTALNGLHRFIVTPGVSKHRVFVWAEPPTLPDHALFAIARDDDTSFGILQSHHHEVWALRTGTSLEDRPRYTPTTTFETFPFPEGLTPDIAASDYADNPHAIAIGTAAARLNELRENWLNPADLVRCEPEVVPGYPDRILPVDEKAAAILKKRTLTNLYNERPTWLDHAHRALDEAVAAAYGWPADLSDDDILARLFALNQERAAAQS